MLRSLLEGNATVQPLAAMLTELHSLAMGSRCAASNRSTRRVEQVAVAHQLTAIAREPAQAGDSGGSMTAFQCC